MNKIDKPTMNFIEKARLIHGDKYSYEKSVYVGRRDELTITCPDHGDFNQTPRKHLEGGGCECHKIVDIKSNTKSTIEEFIKKAIKKHGEKYSYEKAIYAGATTRLTITCPDHGDFDQTPTRHLNGGCAKCATDETALTTEGFIKRSMDRYDKMYSYEKTVYVRAKDMVTITCLKHGDFEQRAGGHLSNIGCAQCVMDNITQLVTSTPHTTDEFIKIANAVHDNKYSYEKTIYKNNKEKIIITCKDHDDFKQTPNAHTQGNGCKKCSNDGSASKWELEIRDYIKSIYYGETSYSNRTMIGLKEIDIYLPDLKIGIELNGMYWHSTKNKPKKYHIEKRKLCESAGVRLVSIWGDEWMNDQQKIKDYLKNMLVQPESRYYARKLEIRHVSTSEQVIFLGHNHFQGYTNNSICFGLYNKENNELIQLMSLKLKNANNRSYEIGRLCTKRNCVVIGGSEKLFKQLKSEVDGMWDTIISYNNLDKFTGEVYKKLGMELVSEGESYFYGKNNKRASRESMQKSKLINRFKKEGLDYEDKTEAMMADELGYLSYYTSGVNKWELKSNAN